MDIINKQNLFGSAFIALVILAFHGVGHAESAQEWIPLFDGKTLTGWTASENPESFRVVDGAILCDGPRAHLYYSGDVSDASFRNFELKAEVLARPGANSGIFFHTEFQEIGYPTKGYEAQVNNSYQGSGGFIERKMSGSLYAVRNVYRSIVQDNAWFEMHIVVQGRRIQIYLDGTRVVDYIEPDQPVRTEARKGRVLGQGTFALQCHDPGSKVMFRNIRVRELPPPEQPATEPEIDDIYRQITLLNGQNFPLIDFHVHLKGGLTLEQAIANSQAAGINYGIAANCGIGFPITSDQGVKEFADSMRGQPVFIGMQAEGREWMDLFSPESLEWVDYVFTDSMTFTDDQGRRTRLWMPEEVWVEDEQEFMDMLVRRIEKIMDREPIDIYVNPTFLPACIADRYDELWTPERMARVVDALARNGVAMEINSRFRLPSLEFIELAKSKGVLFTLGTNNGGSDDLGRLEYSLEMVRRCGLTEKDMWMPGSRSNSRKAR